MNILLTGGTGYIGSHAAVSLLENGHQVTLYDNLVNSHERILEKLRLITSAEITFVKGDVLDTELLVSVIRRNNIDTVIHFAGLKSVGESTAIPLEYFSCNISGAISVARAMEICQVKSLVFSSSATVYGVPQCLPLKEDHPKAPVNPYARSKLYVERIYEDLCKADEEWSVICLRYFNPVGAHSSGVIGENPAGRPNNLMPFISQVAVGLRPLLQVFGSDYPTPDGTGVRDYIHVMDVAEGHVEAVSFLRQNSGWRAFNLGTGRGFSVLDVVQTFEKVSQKKIPIELVPRRAGDVPESYADVGLARDVLSWSSTRNLEEMCSSMWEFQRKNEKDR
jgi:UDP-glucose 4-epimerase